MKCRVLECGECSITQGYKSSHKANDMVAIKSKKKTIDNVVAHTDGKVIAIATGHKNKKGSTGIDSYGNYVQIQHSNGYTTLYAHLDSVYVKVGQTVKKGQKIGVMGNTGNSYGAHLHFEVRKTSAYSSLIDPTPYINSNLPNIEKTVTYRVGNGHWYATVSNGAIAGNQKTRIDRLQIKTKNAGKIYYKAHIKGNKWLPEVTKWDDTSNGYAGIYNNSIDGIAIKSEKGKLSYRVKTKKSGWLPYVSGYNVNDYKNGYAGNLGEEITAIQIKIN